MYFQQIFAVPANDTETIQALTNWQYEFPPGPCRFQVAIKWSGGAAAATLDFDVYSGSDLVVQNGRIPAKSTDLNPNALEDFNINGVIAPPERLGVTLRPNPGGTAATIMVAVKLVPRRA